MANRAAKRAAAKGRGDLFSSGQVPTEVLAEVEAERAEKSARRPGEPRARRAGSARAAQPAVEAAQALPAAQAGGRLLELLEAARDKRSPVEERAAAVAGFAAESDRLERRLVGALRRSGASWPVLGRAYGVSPQAIGQRMRRRGVV